MASGEPDDPRRCADRTRGRAFQISERRWRRCAPFAHQGVKMGVLQARLHLAEMRVDQGDSPIRSLHAACRAKRKEGSLIALCSGVFETALARAYMNARSLAYWALKFYRRAVEAVERVCGLLLYGDDFRVAFLQDKMRLYEELLALLLDRGTPAAIQESFQLVERSKSRTLMERLASDLSRQFWTPTKSAQQARLARLGRAEKPTELGLYAAGAGCRGYRIAWSMPKRSPSERIHELENRLSADAPGTPDHGRWRGSADRIWMKFASMTFRTLLDGGRTDRRVCDRSGTKFWHSS